MKILLILAHTGSKKTTLHKFIYNSIYPSLTLEQLISITPEKYNLDIIDERWQNIDYNWDGEIVGISCLTFSSLHAYQIADEFRKRGKKVVLGGYHPSALPEEAKQHADSVVIGEAEISWPQLLKDFERGKLKPFYHSKPVDPQCIPPATRINKKKVITTSLQATRGCPYGCKYCAIEKIEGNRLRTRNIENVINEIKSINSKNLFFADSSMTINPIYTKKLFEKMKPLNKTFSCYGNINVLKKDNELLKLASDAGCKLWLVGFESISQETVDNIHKKTNIVNEYSSAISNIQDYGMNVMGLFMFGFDTDTPDVFKSTIDAIYEWKLDKAGFAILTPFPGTKLYEKFDSENRILTKNWVDYNLKNVVFKPKKMSIEELQKGTRKLVENFYSFSSSIRRNINCNNVQSFGFFKNVLNDYTTKKFYNIFGW